MSSPLAIAAVTAVLKDLLNNGLIDHNVVGQIGGNVTVTTKPPDRVVPPNGAEPSQLNLFLYQVTPNSGWRNVSLPSRGADGAQLTNPPLALDLHYLLTAYGAEDYHAEILLGYAVQLLHETPILSRDAIRRALSPSLDVPDGSDLPPAFRDLFTSQLAEQFEQIKIVPQVMSTEEMSKLWSALQAHYRPTAAYTVSVVLIEGQTPARSPLPVLMRGAGNRGVISQPDLLPPIPTLLVAEPPNNQPSARLGDVVNLRGHRLDGSNTVIRFSHSRLDTPLDLVPVTQGADRITVLLPNAPAIWPAGLYGVSILVQRPGELSRRTTAEVPMTLAPVIGVLNPTRDAQNNVSVDVSFQPNVFAGQKVSLILGDFEFFGDSPSAPVSQMTIAAGNIAAGTYFARLRVDGVDSLLVDRSVTPPAFDLTQRVAVP